MDLKCNYCGKEISNPTKNQKDKTPLLVSLFQNFNEHQAS